MRVAGALTSCQYDARPATVDNTAAVSHTIQRLLTCRAKYLAALSNPEPASAHAATLNPATGLVGQIHRSEACQQGCFPAAATGVMIASTTSVVTHFTGGSSGAGQGHAMTTQPVGPRSAASSPQWFSGSPTCNRSYVVAGVRAGLIALALLAVLAFIVLV